MKKVQLFFVVFVLGVLFFVGGTIFYFVSSINPNSSSSSYLVLFDANGGKVNIEKKKVVLGNSYGELPVPVKDGYTFDGWFTSLDGGDKITEESTIVNTKNHTLYARWTFNIYGLEPIVNVNNTSVESGDYFGTLYSSSKYINVLNFNSFGDVSIYNGNEGMLQFDEDGALVLDEDNAIAVLDVDKKYNVGDVYSISLTVYGDISQGGGIGEEYARTISAISSVENNYLSWIGIYKNYLHVYSYVKFGAQYAVADAVNTRGFASIDISAYAGSIINIQVVGVRDKKTKVYINGNLVSEFSSGVDKLEYDHLTLGDLRVGRNLKFTGKIYDFAIFDKALSDEQVISNYKNTKAYVAE